MSEASATIPLAEYIFRRIASLGIGHVFGVPGDFNLTLLDHIYSVPELRWIGCCNELNAAYAADGYARVKGTPAVLVTTYGVGELSAMNGVAGAYAEHAGMIHIVGMTARPAQQKRVMIHHTLEPNMNHDIYIGMSEPVRKTYTFLTEDATMADEVDRVIIATIRSKQPCFIYVPMDTVAVPIDANRLESPLHTEIENPRLEVEDEVVSRVLNLITQSSRPAILADVLTIRHGGQTLARKLAEITHFPSYSTPLSKGIIDETSPYYNGLYNGIVSFPGVPEALESSDLVVNIGPLLSDSNTGGFTRKIPDEKLVLLGHDKCQVNGQNFEGVHFIPVLKRIVKELQASQEKYRLPRDQFWTPVIPPVLSSSTSGTITQSFLWQRLGHFIAPNDIVITEAGTAQFGIPDATFPKNVSYITQIYWSSIGFSIGACLGACVAAREMKRPGRIVLLVGDGSLQMTVQEVSSYIRYGFKPVIFVINNDGYSIERAIHGPKQTYNDISNTWDYQKMLEFFGARGGETGAKSKSVACRTIEELEEVLNDPDFARADCIQLCEIFMDKFDYPWRLTAQIDIAQGRRK